MISGTVIDDLSDLHAYSAEMESGMRSGSGVFGAMFKQWAARYRAYVQERFVRYSRGGGDWPPLKHKRRHGRGKKERASILRDTSTLFAALNPEFSGNPGALEEPIAYGVEVGYGGSARHPSSRRLTVAGIAEVHDKGLGNNPQRRIIVPPDRRVLELMATDAERALDRIRR